MAPNKGSICRQAQWQVACLPFSNPAAPSTNEPVQTDVRYFALAASRVNSFMNARSLITSVAAWPPGTNSRSQRSMSARRAVRENVRPPSLATSPPASQATITVAPGRREKTVCGAVKSSWVRPG
jgi:hypothetical protein